MYLTRVLTRGFFPLTFWTLTLWSVIQPVDHVTSSSWRLLASQRLDAFQAVTRGRSKVECIRDCQKYSHCNSFVFNASSHTCYLLPALSNITDREHLENKVYINLDWVCSEVPECNGSIAWNHNLHNLTGKVTCYDDFINTTDDVSIQCMADGSWQREGMCLRHIWRNPPLSWFPIKLPLPGTDDWSVCVDGIPTLEKRFTVDLKVETGDIALHADFRLNYDSEIKTVLLAYRKAGSFTQLQRVTSAPFGMGQQFHLKITATVSGLFQLYVNNSLLASVSQHPDLPATAINSVEVHNDVKVTSLDLWYQF